MSERSPLAARLRRRADLLAQLRKFFDERGFCEVETPLVDDEVIPERHIEPRPVPSDWPGQPSQWLQASPELAMKRLLTQGCTPIYQVTRSFRGGERGPLHRPEFTLVEWYRRDDDFTAGIDLLAELTQHMLAAPRIERIRYADAFQQYVGVDPHTATCAELAAQAARLKIAVPDTLPRDDRDEWLNLLLALRVERQLGQEVPAILTEYPASQAALATTAVNRDGVLIAERFELYVRGVELANGYHELTDAAELRTRLELANAQRAADGRSQLPLPESLLSAMTDPGLPPCAGCALGFDRLAMLCMGATAIDP